MKEFGRIKVVTTRKEHECEVCSEPIPKGVKALVNYGYAKYEGYFHCYFHLDKKNACYLDAMEAMGILPSSTDGRWILSEIV